MKLRKYGLIVAIAFFFLGMQFGRFLRRTSVDSASPRPAVARKSTHKLPEPPSQDKTVRAEKNQCNLSQQDTTLLPTSILKAGLTGVELLGYHDLRLSTNDMNVLKLTGDQQATLWKLWEKLREQIIEYEKKGFRESNERGLTSIILQGDPNPPFCSEWQQLVSENFPPSKAAIITALSDRFFENWRITRSITIRNIDQNLHLTSQKLSNEGKFVPERLYSTSESLVRYSHVSELLVSAQNAQKK